MSEFVRIDLDGKVSYLNLAHVRSFLISDSYQDGKPVKGRSMVLAQFTYGHMQMYHGSHEECIAFVESLLRHDYVLSENFLCQSTEII